MSINNINIYNLLKEENKLQPILIPTINNPLESESAGKYIFKNKETFQGKVAKNNNEIRLIKGKYTWPNGQEYYGDLYPDNLFNQKGKIIFPDKSELLGKFDGKNHIIENAIYTTNSRIYQGSFKNNKLHGKFIIKNKEGYPHYLYIGNYYNGAKHGKFSLEKSYKNEIYKITGYCKEGIKYGEFQIFKKNKVGETSFGKVEFDGDFPITKPKNEDLIENKVWKLFESSNTINCMKIINDNDNLLLGSYEYLLIYDINNEDIEIKLDRKILIFRNEEINDFVETKNKQILLCSNKNHFKLIELTLEEKNNNSCLNTTSVSGGPDFHLIQEFKGLENSKNINCIMELSNEMIVSGDCENIILWDYINITNNINENNKREKENNEKEKTIIDKFFEMIGFGSNDDKNDKSDKNALILSGRNSAIPIYEYQIIENQKLYNVYSIVEITNEKNEKNKKNENNEKKENKENKEIIIGVAEPDSKTINFIKIEKTKTMNKFKKIECHDEIAKKNNIMKFFDNKLFVGCKNKLIVIDINKYELIYNVYSESITYITFLDKYIICGIAKKLNNLYDYEGYLCQKKILENPNSGKIKIINISLFTKFKFKKNIVDACIYNVYNENCIMAATNDGKILLLK